MFGNLSEEILRGDFAVMRATQVPLFMCSKAIPTAIAISLHSWVLVICGPDRHLERDAFSRVEELAVSLVLGMRALDHHQRRHMIRGTQAGPAGWIASFPYTPNYFAKISWLTSSVARSFASLSK